MPAWLGAGMLVPWKLSAPPQSSPRPSGAHGFVGRVVEPEHSDYDDCRFGWNGAIDRRPAAVAYATDSDDVAAAVRAATENGFPFTDPRPAAHSVSGRSVRDGALCLDLRALNAVDVDARRADRARGRRRAAVASSTTRPRRTGSPCRPGRSRTPGVGGLTLGGGLGWLMRHHGLTIDSLRARRGGARRRAPCSAPSEHEHPDLFWALRGGGGDFGDRHRVRVPGARGSGR